MVSDCSICADLYKIVNVFVNHGRIRQVTLVLYFVYFVAVIFVMLYFFFQNIYM